MSYDALFQPLQISGCTVPNRIVRTAHSTGTTGDDLIAYHEERAKGGVGLTVIEIAGVQPSTATAVPVYSDDVIPFYRDLSGRLHAHGTKVFQQLWHGGAAYRRGGQPVSAGTVPVPSVNVVPRPMSTAMIADTVAAFAVAARRCREGGLDGVELHGAHGYLIGQFLSPATNTRDDGYGGSTANRCRFLIEILDAIRADVGSDFPVGVRLSGTDFIDGGIGPDEAALIARHIESRVDFIDVSMSSYWRFHKFLSTLDDPFGYELETSTQVTKVVDVPTIVTGRIMTLDHANHLVESGAADLVSMVRAMIADPYLVAKARQGREAEIRPCIGTSMGCVAQLMTTGRIQCVVNIAAGAERHVPFEPGVPAPVKKKVLVAGGGPAGLEAARTAALRGHDVHLYEMTSELGGQVRMAASAPHRSDLQAITRWLSDEVVRLGVKVHLRTPVDPDVVADLSPDEVIVATGSVPRRDGFQLSSPSRPVPGGTLPHVYTSWDVLGFGGRASVGRCAVVYDDTGTFEAVSAADKLLAAGASVTIVSRLEQLGANIPYPPATVEASRERLYDAGVEWVPAMALRSIGEAEVVAHGLGDGRERRFPADTVVIVTYHRPNSDLADYLEERGVPVHRAGNVNGTDSIQAAIREAAVIARTI
ncbi:MAG TPA: FAD-dependent oxidoreductase [Acidimicrobiales bacterium]|nr:FAD-dependent oxidoreductase [Acidimicrobiales bacterium]